MTAPDTHLDTHSHYFPHTPSHQTGPAHTTLPDNTDCHPGYSGCSGSPTVSGCFITMARGTETRPKLVSVRTNGTAALHDTEPAGQSEERGVTSGTELDVAGSGRAGAGVDLLF